jgi:predicted GNAT family acetyltransferase
VLGAGDEQALRSLMWPDPATHCFAEARLDAGGLRPHAPGGPFWGYGADADVTSALLVGANLVPIATDSTSREAFAEYAIREGRRSSSIVGPATEVLDLWRHLRPFWGPAREVRPDQHLMIASREALVGVDPEVRPSVATDVPTLFPACVAMFTEEVGVSPTAGGMEYAYRRRVKELVADGRSFVRYDGGGEPLFKAEIGALSTRACQIQGVWVPPDRRRQGIAASGMAAVVQLSKRRSPLVSLYVNGYNTGALRAYRAAGFETVSRFATVLF